MNTEESQPQTINTMGPARPATPATYEDLANQLRECQRMLGARDRERQLLDEILEKFSKRNRQHVRRGVGGVAEFLEEYANETARVISGAKAFRDDLLVYLRATIINIDAAGGAGTHKEKDARLRGAVDVLERFVAKLREMQFEYLWSTCWPGDHGRSDFPTRELLHKIHELTAENERLKQSPPPADDAWSQPGGAG